ncbi:fibronectin type III domain-containing protein [Crossiella sp. SN42]|uniref:fibronectin type III domain-containing protein n=1 Tax=Crossiella sp. SN42 TaxID=2944808 RepID=UPI00207C77F9|nr:fibronectin type III domain-containing protein [Crossiella sp. SN42]MCO1579810.1 fibronectin type III domain-containing protein [Crossiella sp. SN42]
MTKLRAVLPALALLLCACAPTESAPPADQLTGQLDTPVDITLRWRNSGPPVAGRVIEYSHEPNGDYTVLKFLAPEETSYRHADLIPETRFYYRLRPYHGAASPEQSVTMPEPKPGDKPEEDSHEWAVPQTLPGAPAATQSLRANASASAPTEVKATVMTSQGIRFTWRDNATDEDHYAIESKAAGAAQWGTAALLDPDINSFGLVTLPEERTAAYRVRAFYYGPASNLVDLRTGRGKS